MIQCANINPDIIAGSSLRRRHAIHLCLSPAKPLQWIGALFALFVLARLTRDDESGPTHPHPPKNNKRNDEAEYSFIIRALGGVKTLSTGQIYRARLLMQFLGGT